MKKFHLVYAMCNDLKGNKIPATAKEETNLSRY